MTLRIANAVRGPGREYRADLMLDGRLVGSVYRDQDGRGGGYRAGSYIARVGRWKVATGEKLADLRADLADPELVAEIIADLAADV